MKGNRGQVYRDAEDFFELEGSVVMMLSTDAAVEACLQAAARGFVVVRIEGGIWRNPGFEARLDCIWDGVDPPVSKEEAHYNNQRAAAFIRDESDVHDVFILTAPPITGYLTA